MQPIVGTPLPGIVYPPQAILERYVRAGALSFETLPAAFMKAFELHADRMAITGARGEITYREFDDRTNRLAAALLKLGAQPLDRAIFQMANSVELLTATIACLKSGVIPVCTLASFGVSEIYSIGRHAEARFWFVDGDNDKLDLRAFAAEHRESMPSIDHVIVARGVPLAAQVAMQAIADREPSPEARALVRRAVAKLDPFQVALFQLSGGTSGVPKLIPRFSNEYLGNMRCMIAAAGRPARDPEVVFSAGPYLHNAGFVCHWGPSLLIGGSILVTNDYTEDGLLDAFLQYRPTWASVPKPLLLRLVAAKKRRGESLPSVQHVFSMGGVSIIRDEIGARPVSVFGMAEGPMMITRPDDPADMLEESVGRPICEFDEVRLVEPGTMVNVPDGTMGEMLVRGPHTTHGYYRAEEHNREAFTEDGYLRTGDVLLRRTVGGRIHYSFQGRIKDIVKRAGETISCEDIERVLRAMPGIADVLVVPVSDPVYLERACACLILQPGAAAPTVRTMGAYLGSSGLAKFKWPEHVQVFDAFPTTKSGKASKPLLREQATERIHTSERRS